jgi:hypothetical protein
MNNTTKTCFLISLETSANQAYVYSSNKLRDVVGASELIYRAGTLFVQKAVEIATGRSPNLQKITTDEPVIENHTNSKDPAIEVVIATSGKAVLLADSVETAKKFITAWSKRVTECAPGLDTLAVYSEKPIDMGAPLTDGINVPLADEHVDFMTAFRDAGKNFSVLKSSRAFVASRFQRIPVVTQCKFSGFPAEKEEPNAGGSPMSRVARAKLEARRDNDFGQRMARLFGDKDNPLNRDKKVLEDLQERDWVAVVHADGNGLGQVFTSLDKSVKILHGESANGRDYVNCYRNFSNALDRISETAFKETVETIFPNDKFAPVVPIVVGGDDLTVMMDGYRAIRFTKLFMEKFCAVTGQCDDVSKILHANDSDVNRLGMCGGICITKPHFPFSASYRLTEELTKSAKNVKKTGSDCSAIDFHVLYDSVVTSMDDIRGKLAGVTEKAENFYRTAKPYSIDLNGHEDTVWETAHSYGRFERAVKALEKRKEDDQSKRSLPSSQSHAIRDSLYSELLDTQEAEWKYLMGKKDYEDFAKAWEDAMGETTLYLEADGAKYTYFLDALEAVKFLKGSASAGGEGYESNS